MANGTDLLLHRVCVRPLDPRQETNPLAHAADGSPLQVIAPLHNRYVVFPGKAGRSGRTVLRRATLYQTPIRYRASGFPPEALAFRWGLPEALGGGQLLPPLPERIPCNVPTGPCSLPIPWSIRTGDSVATTLGI